MRPISAVRSLRGRTLLFTAVGATTTAFVVMTASLGLAGNGQGNSGNGKGNGPTPPTQSENRTFTVKRAATDSGRLAIGVPTVYKLTITNNAPQAIKVQTVTVTAGNAGACSKTHLQLGSGYTSGTGSVSPTSLIIPANATLPLDFPVRLSAAAGNDCQNVTFPLTFGGTAVQS